MLPAFLPDDIVLISTLPYFFSNPKTGDVIVFRKEEKRYVKRITKNSNGKFYVGGDNKNDSLDIGWIKKNDIIGKVLIKIS